MGNIDAVRLVLEQVVGMAGKEAGPETRFAEDLDLDSLEMVELVMKLEEVIGVEIPDSVLESMGTVGDVLEYLEKKGAQWKS